MSSDWRGLTIGSSAPWKIHVGVRPMACAYSPGGFDLAPAIGLIGPEDAAADGNQRGETVRVGFRDFPRAIAAERETGEVDVLAVAMELLDFSIERGDGHGHHVGIGPVMMAEGDLGHDDDEGPAVGMDANGLGKADLGFVHALRAALAGAMEEEDDRPGLFAVPVFRQIDDVAVEDAVDFERAIEEAGVLEAGGGVGRENKKEK